MKACYRDYKSVNVFLSHSVRAVISYHTRWALKSADQLHILKRIFSVLSFLFLWKTHKISHIWNIYSSQQLLCQMNKAREDNEVQFGWYLSVWLFHAWGQLCMEAKTCSSSVKRFFAFMDNVLCPKGYQEMLPCQCVSFILQGKLHWISYKRNNLQKWHIGIKIVWFKWKLLEHLRDITEYVDNL